MLALLEHCLGPQGPCNDRIRAQAARPVNRVRRRRPLTELQKDPGE